MKGHDELKYLWDKIPKTDGSTNSPASLAESTNSQIQSPVTRRKRVTFNLQNNQYHQFDKKIIKNDGLSVKTLLKFMIEWVFIVAVLLPVAVLVSSIFLPAAVGFLLLRQLGMGISSLFQKRYSNKLPSPDFSMPEEANHQPENLRTPSKVLQSTITETVNSTDDASASHPLNIVSQKTSSEKSVVQSLSAKKT